MVGILPSCSAGYLASIAKDFGMVGLGVEKSPATMEVGAAAMLHHFAHLKKAHVILKKAKIFILRFIK